VQFVDCPHQPQFHPNPAPRNKIPIKPGLRLSRHRTERATLSRRSVHNFQKKVEAKILFL